MRAWVRERCSIAESVDAVVDISFGEVLESPDLSSGKFSNETKTVDVERRRVDDRGALSCACLAGKGGTGGADWWSFRTECSVRRSVCDRLPLRRLRVSAAALGLLLDSVAEPFRVAESELEPTDASGASEIEGDALGRMEVTLGFRAPSEALDPVRRREETETGVGLADARACRFCWLVVDTDGATSPRLELDETRAGAELYRLVTRGLGILLPGEVADDEEDRAR